MVATKRFVKFRAIFFALAEACRISRRLSLAARLFALARVWLLALGQRHTRHLAQFAQHALQVLWALDLQHSFDHGGVGTLLRYRLDLDHVDLAARDNPCHVAQQSGAVAALDDDMRA